MEPDASSRPAAPPPTEWRALSRLRERVEEAAHEIERLRSHNAALAGRVADLQAQLGSDEALALPGGTDPAALRVKIQGFIDAIDEVLASPGPDAADGDADGDGVPADVAASDPAP